MANGKNVLQRDTFYFETLSTFQSLFFILLLECRSCTTCTTSSFTSLFFMIFEWSLELYSPRSVLMCPLTQEDKEQNILIISHNTMSNELFSIYRCVIIYHLTRNAGYWISNIKYSNILILVLVDCWYINIFFPNHCREHNAFFKSYNISMSSLIVMAHW